MTAISKRAYTKFDEEETDEQSSRSLIEDSSDIIVLLNAENIATYVSPSVSSVLGYTPAEIVGKHVFFLVHSGDLTTMQQRLGEIGQTVGKSLRAEYRLRRKDGSWQWFEGSVTNLLSVSGAGAIIANFRVTSKQNLVSDLNWIEVSPYEHFVQFYESDGSLLDAVSGFIGSGLAEGDTCIVVGTETLRERLEDRLKANGLLTTSPMQGEYISLSAVEILSKFMVDGLPDSERFASVFANMIAQAAKDGRPVRIFGEMVAQLWVEGNQVAAIQLEKLWNDLRTITSPFALFCAYSMCTFTDEADIGAFNEICKQHSLIIPGKSSTSLRSPDERVHSVTPLRQKANSLDTEMAERKKRAEQALFRLAAIVESSDDAILSKDLNGIITSWNAAAERIYGYSAQEIIGQPVSLLFVPGHQSEFEQIMEHIYRGERVEHFETTRVRKDGTFLSMAVTVSPIKDSSGFIIGASSIARDITEQKRLEARSQRLFDSNIIGVFVSDFSGTFVDANDAFLNLLGYTRAELQAGAIERDLLTPAEFHSLSQVAVKDLQKAGSSEPYEKEYLHKSGKRIPVLVAVTRIDQATDTCIGFVLDISERKELDRRKDEFISMASHELKTPVTSLKGFLSLLQRRLNVQGDEKTLHYLTRMDSQINKLIKLINDLLDLSKMQTGQLIYREERFEVDAMVQEILENVQETTQTHHLQLEGHVQAEVFGDWDRVGQVLINLLNNAIKYSHQADTVLIRVAKDQQNVHISVQDFGIGIAEEYQQKVFERFYQVTDVEEKTYPGLGIGLYISCEIVKRHGGRMWVESEKDHGATFHFTLPLSR